MTADLNSMEDDELVGLAQAGNDQAFTILIGRHKTSCMKLALSILRDKSDAEDEVQNAMWKAFEHIQQFNREAKFSTWLTRIVVNQCLMRLRQIKRARLFYMDDLPLGEEVVSLDLPDTSENPEDLLGRSEIGAVLQKEISRIPPLLREVFVMRDVEDKSMPEVAERLGISVAAAKSRLLRARNELKLRMEKHQSRLGPSTLLA
jgi:RNA polymerase sigma-70 factor, ECF subfamily